MKEVEQFNPISLTQKTTYLRKDFFTRRHDGLNEPFINDRPSSKPAKVNLTIKNSPSLL